MSYCEDFPACGHTPDDPCTREWYDHPDAFNPAVNPHCFCDHEVGCDVEEYGDEADPATCEHGDTSTWDGDPICDWCNARLMMVTDVSSLVYPSKVIPGMRFEIPVLGWHWEVAA